MKTFNTIEELQESLDENKNLIINDDITITFSIPAGIIRGLNCRNFICWDLSCQNLSCWNLNCLDLSCRGLNCWDLKYYAFCIAYKSLVCNNWKAGRDNFLPPVVLDGKLIIRRIKA